VCRCCGQGVHIPDICVQLSVSTAMLCEIHPRPKVNTTLALISGTKVSKLHANTGIPLARILTTSITPYGHFCLTGCHLAISSAPKIFQCRISEVLSGYPGVFFCLVAKNLHSCLKVYKYAQCVKRPHSLRTTD